MVAVDRALGGRAGRGDRAAGATRPVRYESGLVSQNRRHPRPTGCRSRCCSTRSPSSRRTRFRHADARALRRDRAASSAARPPGRRNSTLASVHQPRPRAVRSSYASSAPIPGAGHQAEGARSELRQLDIDPSAVEEILPIREHRLLTFDREPSRTPTVEVAHEAILSQWGRLRAWIEERRALPPPSAARGGGRREWQDRGATPSTCRGRAGWRSSVVGGCDRPRRDRK